MYFWVYFLLLVHSLLLVEMPHSLRAVMHTKLLIEVGDVPLQCPLGDDQLLCHFLVREPHRKQLEDLPLPARQHRTLSLSSLPFEMIQNPIEPAPPYLLDQFQ